MRLIKGKPARWVVPTALAAILVAGLLISPAIGGPKFVTGKKVNKTINKRTNATEVRITTTNKDAPAPPANFDSPTALIGSLPLKSGAYVITSTFDISRAGGLPQLVQCRLSAGSAKDQTSTLSSGPDRESGALSLTTTLTSPSTAELRCVGAPSAGNQIGQAEITALRVPKATNTTAP